MGNLARATCGVRQETGKLDVLASLVTVMFFASCRIRVPITAGKWEILGCHEVDYHINFGLCYVNVLVCFRTAQVFETEADMRNGRQTIATSGGWQASKTIILVTVICSEGSVQKLDGQCSR